MMTMFTTLIIILLPGCFRETPKPPLNVETPLEKTSYSFEKGIYPSELELFPEYRLKPGDVLDVLFQFRRDIKGEYRIDLGDEISIKFIELPQLNVTQRVLPDGSIMLPYLGRVKVVGRTIENLTDDLKRKYSNILKKPQLFVTVPKFRTQIEELKRDLRTAPRGLSKLVTVRPDGYVTFPLLGDLFVADRTIPEVNAILNERYNQFMPGLRADLFLQKHASAVVHVLGEVGRPGAYEMTKPISVLEALSLAGGYTRQAKLDSVVIFRKHERRIVAKVINVSEGLSVSTGATFFYLRPEDVVYIPRRRISSLAQLLGEIGDIAFFRGWSIGFSYALDRGR